MHALSIFCFHYLRTMNSLWFLLVLFVNGEFTEYIWSDILFLELFPSMCGLFSERVRRFILIGCEINFYFTFFCLFLKSPFFCLFLLLIWVLTFKVFLNNTSFNSRIALTASTWNFFSFNNSYLNGFFRKVITFNDNSFMERNFAIFLIEELIFFPRNENGKNDIKNSDDNDIQKMQSKLLVSS